jgi:hypothetical protein
MLAACLRYRASNALMLPSCCRRDAGTLPDRVVRLSGHAADARGRRRHLPGPGATLRSRIRSSRPLRRHGREKRFARKSRATAARIAGGMTAGGAASRSRAGRRQINSSGGTSGLERGGRERPADDETLHPVAACGMQEIQRLLRLSTASAVVDQPQLMGQHNGASHQPAGVLVLVQQTDEPPIYLQFAEGRAIQVTRARTHHCRSARAPGRNHGPGAGPASR